MSTQAFDFSVDLLQCLLWQHNQADRLRTLIQRKQEWYDEKQAGFWQDWMRDVFDLATANDFGLGVWARILSIPLFVGPSPDDDRPLWGFGPDNVGFTQGNFSSATGVSHLTTEQRRLVLRLRYFQLITRGAVTEVNAFLAQVFGPGVVYVADGLDMHAVYVFVTPPSAAVELVLTTFDVLPRPAGVGVGYVVQGEADGFGFGRYHENFDNGAFLA